MKTKKKGTTIGFAEKLGYAGISVADNLRGSYRGTFMQFFCTNVLMIRPGILATLMSLVTIWDAINDPLIASYADNHPNKNGDRARQYLWAGIPLSIIMILMFVRFSMNPTISLMIIFCLNILFSVATTFHRLPFYAMMILVSPHEADRLSVNKFHFFGTAIGTALGSLAMWPLVRLVGGVDEAGNVANPEKGFLMGMVVVGAIVIILSLYHYYTTKERVHPQQTEKTPMIEAIKILFKKAVFRRNVILDFLRSTIIAGTTGYALYYVTYVLGKPGFLTAMYAIYLISNIIALPFLNKVIEKLGKRMSLIASAVLLIVGEIIFIVFAKNIIGGISLVLATGLATAMINVVLSLNRARVADEVEDEDEKGRRVDSMVSNVNGFAIKCGTSVVSLAFGWILELSGYDATLAVQPTSAINGIIFIMGWLVIICCVGLILAAPKDKVEAPKAAVSGTEGE